MNTTTEMQLVPVEKLIPYINNARTHSEVQIKKLRSSLREFGFINPVIIDRNFNVIAGHGRILAAKAESISEVPCVFVDYLNDAQKKAYILADNRMAMDAGWDEELLRVEIESLQGADFDIGLTGFDEDEIAELFADDNDNVKDDDFDVEGELEKPPVTKSGDLWLLGNHRLICGDSTKEDTYTRLMDGKKANLVVTDPPYNVNYEGSAGKIKNTEIYVSRINIGSIAIYNSDEPCVVSPMYSVFRVTDTDKVLPEYLMLWFSRTEFQRYTWYYAAGSVRDTFDFNLMQEVEFPIPSIEIQKDIVNILTASFMSRLEYGYENEVFDVDIKLVSLLEEHISKFKNRQWVESHTHRLSKYRP